MTEYTYNDETWELTQVDNHHSEEQTRKDNGQFGHKIEEWKTWKQRLNENFEKIFILLIFLLVFCSAIYSAILNQSMWDIEESLIKKADQQWFKVEVKYFRNNQEINELQNDWFLGGSGDIEQIHN